MGQFGGKLIGGGGGGGSWPVWGGGGGGGDETLLVAVVGSPPLDIQPQQACMHVSAQLVAIPHVSFTPHSHGLCFYKYL